MPNDEPSVDELRGYARHIAATYPVGSSYAMVARALLARLPVPVEGESVRVRVPGFFLRSHADGAARWYVPSWSAREMKDNPQGLDGSVPPHFWLTATVPLPRAVKIEASVEGADHA